MAMGRLRLSTAAHATQHTAAAALGAIFLLCGVAEIAASNTAAATNYTWQDLREGLDAWADLSLDANFAVNVGDENGTLFTYTSNLSMSEDRLVGASLSKWPAAMMISGLVADGTIGSFDDKVNKYLGWWAQDQSGDPRADITLANLLSFTSGFEYDSKYVYLNCKLGDYDSCAQRLYNDSYYANDTVPGSTFAYLSCHLQFAGAVATAASNLSVQELFKKYLYEPYGMEKTTWGSGENDYWPIMAAGMVTTGSDFEGLLQGLLNRSVLRGSVSAATEVDYTKGPRCNPSGDGWFGHYSFGHWFECLGYGTPDERALLPPVCEDAHIQAGPGEFGYYPLIDRSGGGGAAGPKRRSYYMQVVLQEPDSLSGIPEYLRIVVKPLVDVILSRDEGLTKKTTSSRQELLNQGAGLIRRDISFIRSELHSCKCAGSNATNEPYASMLRHLPKDQPNLNRRDIAAKGIGLLLSDIVTVRDNVGNCSCKGRSGSV